MRRTAVLLSVFALVLLVIGATPALAQAPADRNAPQAQAQTAAPIEGDLVRVDADAKLLVVKPADGAEVEFKYSDKTEISGAKDGAAGLATMKEGRVTVHFTEDAQSKAKTATKIEIAPKK